MKLHLGLDHGGHLPAFACVTDGKAADIEAARKLRLPVGSIVAADRAYMDFDWINGLIRGSNRSWNRAHQTLDFIQRALVLCVFRDLGQRAAFEVSAKKTIRECIPQIPDRLSQCIVVGTCPLVRCLFFAPRLAPAPRKREREWLLHPEFVEASWA